LHKLDQRLRSDHTLNTIHVAAAHDRQQAGILGQSVQHAFERMVKVNVGVVIRDDRCDGSFSGAGVERALDLRTPEVKASANATR
jgi:hypothetical protein